MNERKTVYRKSPSGKLSIYNAQNQKDYKKDNIRQFNISYSRKTHEKLIDALDVACNDQDIKPIDFAKRAIKEKLIRDGYLSDHPDGE